jgi:hypothetical protein
MPAISKAGMYFTPCLDASHVVPHKILTTANAKMAFALVPFCLMVKGFNADKLFTVSAALVIVLLKLGLRIKSASLPFLLSRGEKAVLYLFIKLFVLPIQPINSTLQTSTSHLL